MAQNKQHDDYSPKSSVSFSLTLSEKVVLKSLSLVLSFCFGMAIGHSQVIRLLTDSPTKTSSGIYVPHITFSNSAK